MAGTEFALNDPLAVQRWSQSLSKYAEKASYFSKFIGEGESIIVAKKELSKGAGDKITMGLRAKLSMPGVVGDNLIKDTSAEEALQFFSDAIFIDQYRKSTKSKGKMSEQRVPYNMRREGRDALAVFFGELYDEMMMIYLSGARGVNEGFINPVDWTGFANNSIQAPDAAHQMYAGTATAKANLTSADTFSIATIEALREKTKMMRPKMTPAKVNGGNKFVLLLSPMQARQLRSASSSNDWIDIRKSTDGQDSPLYNGSLGEYAGFILHEHENVIQFNDYGSGSDLAAARALCLGVQAGLIAWGQDSGQGRYSWNEESDDRGNALAITAGAIFGVKKARYNAKDFGVIAIDSYIPQNL